MHSTTKIAWLVGVVALLGAGVTPAQADQHDRSPALCGIDDTKETGIQGSTAPAEGFNCGLSLVGELSGGGAVQGFGHCAYVRSGSGIRVIDVSDPFNPTEVEVGSPVQTSGSSETMRAVVTGGRVVLVSGSSVFDISDCETPVPLGTIPWPDTVPGSIVGGGPFNIFGGSHDLRVSHDATKVYGSFGLKEADITNLDLEEYTVRDYTCDIHAQYHPLHQLAFEAGGNLCDLGYFSGPGTLQLSHGPDTNQDGTRVYVGGQQYLLPYEEWLWIIDMTEDPPKVLDSLPDSPGHSVDWFRIADREYVLHAGELTGPGVTCMPADQTLSPAGPGKRPAGNDAFLTEVTGDTLKRASILEMAINKPENCLSSGLSPSIAYHSVDDPFDASFAMISWGSAGLRVFDIRNPQEPTELAYFNRGSLQHAGVSHYDAARGLIYVPGGNALQVLEIQPQVYDALGLPQPDDGDYPRFPEGRPARPAS